MAPGQVPHHGRPWRDAQALYLLSPLMGFLSRAWSLLRGPGPPDPWLAETGRGDELEAGVEGKAKASPAGPHFLQSQNPQGEAEDSRNPQEEEEAAAGPSLDLAASSSAPEACRLGCGHCGEYRTEAAAWQQPGEFTCGQPELLSCDLLLSALQDPDKSPGDQQAEEEGVTQSAYLSSHCQGGPAREDAEAVNKEATATAASASSLTPGLKPSTWLCCPGEEDQRATEDRENENTEARESPIDSPWSSSCPGTWQSCLGEAAEKGTEAREVGERRNADPEPWPSVPRLGLLLWQDQPREDEDDQEEEEEEENKCCDSLLAEEEVEARDFSTPTTNTFLRAWVYQPQEDTEEEEEEEVEEDDDRDLGSAEEGKADVSLATLSTSTCLRAWVYQPGEDTEEEEDEDSDSGPPEERGEASASGAASSTLGTSTFLKAWVYRPGEDTEDEDEWEENQDTGGESGAVEDSRVDCSPSTSLQFQGFQPRAWTAPSGDRTKEEHLAEAWAGVETRPLAVAIYVPGQKPPAPWDAPKLPLRLQRRLKVSETLPRNQDPEASPKARKVRFSEKVTVHLLAVWAGPAQAARHGPWEQLARDRSRFTRRISQAEEELGPCLTPAWRARAWARLGNTPGPPSPVPLQSVAVDQE